MVTNAVKMAAWSISWSLIAGVKQLRDVLHHEMSSSKVMISLLSHFGRWNNWYDVNGCPRDYRLLVIGNNAWILPGVVHGRLSYMEYWRHLIRQTQENSSTYIRLNKTFLGNER